MPFQREENLMAIADPADQTVVTSQAAASADPVVLPVVTRRSSTMRPGGAELGRRVVVLVFGLIQIVIGLRVVLLVLDAREGNPLVSGILNLSQVFVAPFDGVLHTNALHSGGSILDLAAIAALVGWSVLELIVLWAIGIFRAEPA
jgi:hypothetical protein